MFEEIYNNLKTKKPLIHNITNYVTVNDVANIEIAIGASPLMADELLEMDDMQSFSSALNINIGTLNQRTVKSMLIAGKAANKNRVPVILDPVGVGASKYRKDSVKSLLEQIKFTVIKGNISEIKAIRLLLNDIDSNLVNCSGVDALDLDSLNDKNIDDAIKLAKNLSKLTGAVIIITSVLDVIADENKAYTCSNGCPNMHHITGTGCMLSGLVSSFVGANPKQALLASLASVCTIGYAGELADILLIEHKAGNSSFRNYLIDSVFNLNLAELEKGASYEIHRK